MNKGISLVLALVMCLSLCACGAEKQTVEINYGEECTIELKKQQEGIVWETDNPDIVNVQNGTVTGIAPGNAIVTATKDGKTVAEITVSVNIIDISAILFSQKNVEIELDESMQLQYMLMPDNASDYGLSWKSANTEIAEVGDTGNIRAVAPGTTTIVCSTPSGVIDTCEVIVKEPSAIEQLNEEEAKVFQEYLKNIQSFYNAPAARIKALISIEKKGDSAGKPYTAKDVLFTNIQGTNRLGGTLFKYYLGVAGFEIPNQDFMTKKIDGVNYIEIPSEFMDIGKINAAIEEYWEKNIH